MERFKKFTLQCALILFVALAFLLISGIILAKCLNVDCVNKISTYIKP